MSSKQKSGLSKSRSEKSKKTSTIQKTKKNAATNMSEFSFMQRARKLLSVANSKLRDVFESMKTRLSEQTEKRQNGLESHPGVVSPRPVMSGKTPSSARQ